MIQDKNIYNMSSMLKDCKSLLALIENPIKIENDEQIENNNNLLIPEEEKNEIILDSEEN